MILTNSWSKLYDKCIRCMKIEHRHKAKGLCVACYQKEHHYPEEPCSICGIPSRVHKRTNDKPICRKCYKEPLHTCSICGKSTTAALKNNNSEFVCDQCYKKYYRPKQKCSLCGNTDILAVNSDDQKICVKCYPTLNNLCSKCGRDMESPYVLEGRHVCNRCYENSKKGNSLSTLDIEHQVYTCSICGRSGVVQRIYNDRSVICQACSKQQSDICSSCGIPTLPIHSHLSALPYCRNCYYKEKLRDIFKKLKKNWSESFTNILEDYFSNKALKVSYETIWEHVTVSEALLNDLYAEFVDNGSIFLTGSLMGIIKKHYSQKLFINDFIAFLCSKGILPDYDSGLVLLDNLNEQIYKLPIIFQKVIIPYKGTLLQKLSKYKEKGWVNNDSKFGYYTCYLYLLTSYRFLAFVNILLNLHQPTEINNHVVDTFIRFKPYEKGNLRHFIAYMNKNKITFMHLTIPESNYRHELHIGISNDRQRKLLEDCLYNDNILLRDRILVIIMLLYGITPEEIRTLEKNNFSIIKSMGKLKILFHKNHVKHEIPPIISTLILKHLNSLSKCSEFAFPGRYFNSPISLSSICRIMKDFEVTATELYYTALNNAMLFGLNHPALLMKSFGISHTTATRYFKLINSSVDQFLI